MAHYRRLALVGAFLFCLLGAAHAVNDGYGKDWRWLPDTIVQGSLRPTWEQIAAVCPADGATPCAGSLSNVRMKDWVWATSPQVLELFGRYAPPLAQSGANSIGGYEWFGAANLALGQLGITSAMRGCPTYQPCFNYQEGHGITASLASAALPAVAIGAYVNADLENSIGGFTVYSPVRSDLQRGIWMWRPTGAGTPKVHAYDDAGTPAASGGVAVANVLANDWVAGQRATLANGAVAQLSSTAAGVWLDTSDASVRVAASTAAGSYELVYQLCSRADTTQCDDAVVSVTVRSFPLVARNDLGSLSMAAGGRAIANVLANDTVGSVTATTALVQLTQMSTTHPGVSLNVDGGSVDVAPGTPHGTHSLVYRICERANAANCAQATATVAPFVIDAVNDSARGSSKTGGTVIASVLANDWFNGARATTADVVLSLLAPLPKGISLDLSTGAVRVAPKTSSGAYLFAYRICERRSPNNCDQATVALDLSGRSED